MINFTDLTHSRKIMTLFLVLSLYGKILPSHLWRSAILSFLSTTARLSLLNASPLKITLSAKSRAKQSGNGKSLSKEAITHLLTTRSLTSNSTSTYQIMRSLALWKLSIQVRLLCSPSTSAITLAYLASGLLLAITFAAVIIMMITAFILGLLSMKVRILQFLTMMMLCLKINTHYPLKKTTTAICLNQALWSSFMKVIPLSSMFRSVHLSMFRVSVTSHALKSPLTMNILILAHTDGISLTKAFFDDYNEDSSIDDPDYLDGHDADITYDKVFIPSLSEMGIQANDDYFPDNAFEGAVWEFYSALSDGSSICTDLNNSSCSIISRSAYLNGTDKIIYVNSSLELSIGDVYYSDSAAAPAFVIG